jgi:hypothetical protein
VPAAGVRYRAPRPEPPLDVAIRRETQEKAWRLEVVHGFGHKEQNGLAPAFKIAKPNQTLFRFRAVTFALQIGIEGVTPEFPAVAVVNDQTLPFHPEVRRQTVGNEQQVAGQREQRNGQDRSDQDTARPDLAGGGRRSLLWCGFLVPDGRSISIPVGPPGIQFVRICEYPPLLAGLAVNWQPQIPLVILRSSNAGTEVGGNLLPP